VDLELTGQRFIVVAYDGFPIASHDSVNPTRLVDHVLVPPAGRVEAIVEPPVGRRQSRLRTRCVDTGPDGDPNPGMILADVVVTKTPPAAAADPPGAVPVRPIVSELDLERLKRQPPAFIATFTEEKQRFFINNQLFSLDAAPMVRVKVGQFYHWKVVNSTKEVHPFHMHQAHFLVYLENDLPAQDPQWLDTVNVPVGGSVDVIMDFTNPVIRGMSVFHCHLLNHEDKGMMAKILFE
jgi:FtsP/CotA-like multicopper oxidase with cupredoxin domain